MPVLRHVVLPRAFAHSVATHPDAPCWRVRRGTRWQTWTYREAGDAVMCMASALLEHGVQPGDRVGIFANNRPEWSLVDQATLAVGGIVVTVFATSNAEQAGHILRDSGATLVVVGGTRERDIVAATQELPEDQRPKLSAVVSMDDLPDSETIDAWMAKAPDRRAEVEARTAALTLDDVATVIYTSGTTGAPRGAMLTYRGYDHQLRTIEDHWHLGPGESSLSFLPLAHALERIWTFYIACCGALNTFCENPREIAELMPLARPTTIISVPKLYEKVYSSAHEKVARSRAKKAIFDWAFHVGGRLQHLYRKGATPPWWLRAQLPLADKLVFSAIREAVGGPKTLLISGGAPLRREIEEFFSAAGMLLGQGYGLTETGPMTTVFGPETFKLGTVGRLVPEAQIRLGLDGEILLKGPHIMKGYWNNPEATAKAFDEDGWFHTGDVGYVDTDGYVIITDRLKDIIVTLGGKNVAPQPLEGLILSDPLFEYAVVLGDNRPYLTALLQPSIPGLEALGKQLGLAWNSVEDLLVNPAIVEAAKERVAALQSRLPGFEQVKDVRLMQGLSMEDGSITPTMKVKRRTVEERFADLVEEMYAHVRGHRG